MATSDDIDEVEKLLKAIFGSGLGATDGGKSTSARRRDEDDGDDVLVHSRLRDGPGGVYPQSMAPLRMLSDLNPHNRLIEALLRMAQTKKSEAYER